MAVVDHGQVRGYGLARKCRDGHKIGPLFADDAEAAEALLHALCNYAHGGPVSLDVPEPNTTGVALAKRFGMAPVFSCVRMYLRDDPGLPLERIYGVTSFEAG